MATRPPKIRLHYVVLADVDLQRPQHSVFVPDVTVIGGALSIPRDNPSMHVLHIHTLTHTHTQTHT